jgi:heme exporter protein B
MRHAIQSLLWIVHKDLLFEIRSPVALVTTGLLGISVAVLFSVQGGQSESQRHMLGATLWMAVFLAGVPMMDRGSSLERENGCWDALRLLPVAPSVIFLARLAANSAVLAILECVLIPLFFLLSNQSPSSGAGGVVAVAALATVGLAAIGTLVTCLGLGRRNSSLPLVLVLPLAIPVLVAAAECTRLIAAGEMGDAWWRWMQLLAVFDVVFVAGGFVLFETAIEE